LGRARPRASPERRVWGERVRAPRPNGASGASASARLAPSSSFGPDVMDHQAGFVVQRRRRRRRRCITECRPNRQRLRRWR
ncbi:MAG TPA: hypothetical protein VFZ53_22725, partial [Polyangiaceae bacterium]